MSRKGHYLWAGVLLCLFRPMSLPLQAAVATSTPAVQLPGSASSPNGLRLRIDEGVSVVVNVKLNNTITGNAYLVAGTVTVSKTAVAFHFSSVFPDFTVSPGDIVDVTIDPQRTVLHIRATVNGSASQDAIKELEFYSPRAIAAGTGSGAPGGSVTCRPCDDSMVGLYELLQSARGLTSTEVGTVRVPDQPNRRTIVPSQRPQITDPARTGIVAPYNPPPNSNARAARWSRPRIGAADALKTTQAVFTGNPWSAEKPCTALNSAIRQRLVEDASLAVGGMR